VHINGQLIARSELGYVESIIHRLIGGWNWGGYYRKMVKV